MRFSALTLAAATLLLPALASAQDYGPRHEPSAVIRPDWFGFFARELSEIVNEGAVLEEGVPAHIAASRRAREIYLGEKFRL